MKLSVLTALPHSALDLQKAVGDPQKDYVRNVLRGYTTPCDVIWKAVEPALGVGATQLFDTCERLSVNVVRCVGKPELAVAARASDVIVILAHWKGPEISCLPHDLLLPLQDLKEPLSQCVAKRVLSGEKHVDHLLGMHERIAKDIAARWLNEAIDGWEKWLPFGGLIGDSAGYAYISNAYGRNYARSVIDEIFGADKLLPGARLELADGLWSPSEIAECFPKLWGGVCDFACCTSEYLAEETKCRRPKGLFRADSRYLKPRNLFAALQKIIPILLERANQSNNFASTYMELAYNYNNELESA
jgi:hypothetical protein